MKQIAYMVAAVTVTVILWRQRAAERVGDEFTALTGFYL